jgi:hypothetical protein
MNMAINVLLPLDDIGLFKTPRGSEIKSQFQRACEVRDQFAECMTNALADRFYCCMPDLCAKGREQLSCVHLTVDYQKFFDGGKPLTGKAREKIDARLRAIGTLVYRQQMGLGATDSLPGDVHVPALDRISAFPARRKATGARAATGAPATRKRSGALSRLIGGIFG